MFYCVDNLNDQLLPRLITQLHWTLLINYFQVYVAHQWIIDELLTEVQCTYQPTVSKAVTSPGSGHELVNQQTAIPLHRQAPCDQVTEESIVVSTFTSQKERCKHFEQTFSSFSISVAFLFHMVIGHDGDALLLLQWEHTTVWWLIKWSG